MSSHLLSPADLDTRRRSSSEMDNEFQEAYEAYLERNKRRKSLYLRDDITAVDTSKTQTNLLLTMTIIGALLLLVCCLSLYLGVHWAD